MPVTYLGAVPRPRGPSPGEFYNWARRMAAWFESFYSAAVLHSSGYAEPDVHSWSAGLTFTAESSNAHYFVVRTYKNATVYASTGRPLWLAVVGDGETNYGHLFTLQQGLSLYRGPGTTETEALFAAGSTGVLSAAIVKVGALSTTLRLLGPSGLCLSANVGLV